MMVRIVVYADNDIEHMSATELQTRLRAIGVKALLGMSRSAYTSSDLSTLRHG